MSGRDDDSESFADTMKDVRPLDDRDRTRPPTAPPPKTPEPAARPAIVFELESTASGEFCEGRAPGIDRKLLRRLKAGGYAVEVRVDLHGLGAQEARRKVRAEIAAAADARRRCVLIIHGRGLGSRGAPVLKHALPGWLAEQPCGDRVLAFSNATSEHGGAGATFVLLRRAERER